MIKKPIKGALRGNDFPKQTSEQLDTMKNIRSTGHSARTAHATAASRRSNSFFRDIRVNSQFRADARLSIAMAVALALISSSTKSNAADQTWDGGGAGGGTAWLTGTNWVGDPVNANVPGSTTVTTNTDTGTFGATGSAATIGINLNFTGNTFYLGAINLTTGSRNIGDSSATAGTLRLNGATVNAVSNVILRNAGTGTLTLQALQTGAMGVALGNATDNVVSIDGTGGVTVSSIVSGASGHLTLGGAGSGLLTLSGANTYGGGTTVASGSLRVGNTTGSGTGSGGVTVGNNTGVATLSGTGTISGLVTTATTGANVAHIAPGVNSGGSTFGVAGGTLHLNGGLTIGTGSNLDFDLANTASGTSDLVTFASTALTLSSAFTINYNLLTAGILETAANYTLFSGASNTLDLTGISITSLGLGAYTPTYSVSGGSLLVSFSNVAAPTPNYFDTNGSTAGIGINGGTAVWDTTSTNWTPVVAGTGAAKVFDPSQTAYFGASGGGTAGMVTVDAGGVSANFGIEFDVTGYTLSGGTITLGGATPTVTVPTSTDSATISSMLSGTAGLAKAGAGTLVLGAINDFTGAVGLKGGTLSVGNDGNLGTAANALVFGGGTLTTTTGIVAARAITITAAAGGGTFNTNGFDSSTTGITNINDAFTKAGAGDLSLNNFVNFGAAGALTVSGGSLTFGQFSGTLTMFNGATLNGNLIVKNGIRLNLNGAYTGTGQIQVQTTLVSLANTGSGITVTVANNIVLNSLSNVGPFVTNLGPVSTGNITVNGVISGNADLNIAGGGGGGGTGTLTLNAQNTYTGATTINLAGQTTLSTVKLGIDNALPPTTALSFNTNGSASGTTLDLNGHNQTVASLSYGNANAAATPAKFIITNKSTTTDSTFTVDGATSPANAFSGTISDGTTNKVTVVKAGTGTLTLNGVTTFSTLSVTGGTLNLNAALTTAAGSTIDVTPSSSTATLNIGVSQTIASLNIGPGGVVTVTPPASPAPQFSPNENAFAAGDEIFGSAGVAVPEPSAGMLLLGGLASLVGMRRRR